jgi:uncharacterized protein (DUF4415 family)
MVNKPNPFLIDDENPEWSDAQLDLAVTRRTQRVRGAQKTPLKQVVTIRLDSHIVEKFKATGAGWQSRINAALNEYHVV